MNGNIDWELTLNENKFPCFLVDFDTYEVLVINEVFSKTFNFSNTFLGKVFSDILFSNSNIFLNLKTTLYSKNVFEEKIFDKDTNTHYFITAALTTDGKKILCQLEPLKTADSKYTFSEAITKCLQIYEQPEGTILPSLMKLLCDYYNCGRSYIYRFNFEDITINCVSQWCQDTLCRMTQKIDRQMDSTFLINWVQTESQDKIVSVTAKDKILENSAIVDKIFENLEIENLVLCSIKDLNNKIVGFIGVSNRFNYDIFLDTRLIYIISRFVERNVSKEIMDSAIYQLHYRDSLTGLFNRAAYSRKIDKIMENPPSSMGIISANINGLKYINKNSGITGGDEHIRLSAELLETHFDYIFFRMSGDEFLGIAPDSTKEEFDAKVQSLHKFMQDNNNYDFSLGHSWGGKNFDLSKLMLEAETIMYINKQEYYSVTQRHFSSITDSTLSDLLSYLADDEFMVYLQPQVYLETGNLYGAEALIRRFDKKNQKMVFPDQFISLYEQKSIIRHVDLFVVESVCRLLSEWNSLNKAIPISVNLSRVTLLEHNIVSSISKICDKYNVPHNLLVIEVTERVGLVENNVASSLITEFKDHGFSISLDDFGCAYSNIVTLAQIDVDEVKIDKSLVDYILTNNKNRVLVKNVLSMCNEIDNDTSTLAEGIECAEQADLLHELGCHLGQGYHYSRPIPVAEFYEKYIN